jgi:hypothetical protein
MIKTTHVFDAIIVTWCRAGLLTGGPVLLGRVGVAFIERRPENAAPP